MALDSNHPRYTFEHYLYDYLIKRNMHQTAEDFRNEANLLFDPNEPPTIDVPEGFLLEWWSLNYDHEFVREWLQMHVVQRLEATQGGDTSQAEPCSSNAEAMNELPDNFTPTFNIESNPMPSYQEISDEFPLLYFPLSYQEVNGGLSELLLPPSHQEISEEERLMSTLRAVNVDTISGQGVETFAQNTWDTALDEETDPVIENLLDSFWLFEQNLMELFDTSTPQESNRNMDNFLGHGEGNTDRNKFASFTPPALRDDDNQSETSDCSSNLQIITDAVVAPMARSNSGQWIHQMSTTLVVLVVGLLLFCLIPITCGGQPTEGKLPS